MTTELLSANHAAATAATLAGRANRRGRGFGGGVYPITPQTECIELLCKQEFEKGSVVRVESEHSAMAVCMGFAFGGARAFTASSSNGLAYMVENVFVTLTGNVGWLYQRLAAADSIRAISGVTGVSNQIAIKPSLSATVVKSDIEAALKRRAAADAKSIAVEVKGADVTLTGTVHSWAERDLATRSAWGSAGVRNVVDKMNLVY